MTWIEAMQREVLQHSIDKARHEAEEASLKADAARAVLVQIAVATEAVRQRTANEIEEARLKCEVQRALYKQIEAVTAGALGKAKAEDKPS